MSAVVRDGTALTTAEERVWHVVEKMAAHPLDVLDGLGEAFRSQPVSPPGTDPAQHHPNVDHLIQGPKQASDLRWHALLLRHAADAAHVSPVAFLTLMGATRRRAAPLKHVLRLILAAPSDTEASAWAEDPPDDERLDVLLSLRGYAWATQPDTDRAGAR